MAPDVLRLLCSSRENLRVLEHFAAHPEDTPRKAREALKVPDNTWYRALRQLEDLGLVAAERAPGGKKVRSVTVTPSGHKARDALKQVEGLIAESRAGLELELKEEPPEPGSERAGRVLALLAVDAQRRMAWDELPVLAKRAEKLRRPGEGALARSIHTHFLGDPETSRREAEDAIGRLSHEVDSLSYRLAVYFHAAALSLAGSGALAFRESLRLRKLARQAGDHWMEATALQAMGIQKGRSGQYADAVRYLERAVEAARQAGQPAVEARMLFNLGYARFFVDLDGAIEANDRAIDVSRAVGARAIMAHALLNRALYLAAKGRRAEGLAALRAATAEYKRGGEERGQEAHRDFAQLIRRTLRSRRPQSLQDLRDQAAASTRLLPSRPPAGRKATPRGRGRRGR